MVEVDGFEIALTNAGRGLLKNAEMLFSQRFIYGLEGTSSEWDVLVENSNIGTLFWGLCEPGLSLAVKGSLQLGNWTPNRA